MIRDFRNSPNGEWKVLELRYDHRTGKKGVAVFKHKHEAKECESIAHRLSENSIKTKIIYEQKNEYRK